MIQYKTIGLSYTLRCPLACAHCVTESSPKAAGKMQFEHARAYLPVIRRFSPSVCFTGGEPLLFYREIVELTCEATNLGLNSTLVTGAGWVRGERSARRRVQELAAAGIRGICISWDAYHEAFSPRERAVMLAQLTADAGIQTIIRTVIAPGEKLSSFHAAFAGIPVALETIPVAQVGRAASLPPSHFHWGESLPSGACTTIYLTNIEPDGTVYACCGSSRYSPKSSPLVLGNALLEPLEEILARGLRDPVLEIIHNLGPYGLYLLLKDHPAGRERFKPRAAYTGICDLCLDITNDPVLVAAIQERLEDIDAKRLVAAARMWMEKRLGPELEEMKKLRRLPSCKRRIDGVENVA